MHKIFCNYNLTSLCVKRCQSFGFKWHVLITKFTVKGQFLKFFFGHSMTSEVKDHLYKLVGNPMNHMHKNFRNDIWTGCLVMCFKATDSNI